MNRRHLNFVLRVAETGSFSAAADMCNVTQPTLSAGVGHIEETLGARLFDRNTRSVAITSFGRDILPAIQDVVSAEQALETQANNLLQPELKLVRIAVSPIVEMSKLISKMAPFRLKHPNVEFIYKECFVDEMEDRMAMGTIDMIVLPNLAKAKHGLKSVSLYHDPWVFLPKAVGHATGNIAPFKLSDMTDHSLILTSGYCGLSQATQTLFLQNEIDLNLYPGRALSYSAIEEWADLGLGAALLPASKVSNARTSPVFPVLNDDHTAAMLEIMICWNENSVIPQHIEKLRATLQEAN
jgi:DNA-binding transcriptional LysR family regulator